MSENLQLSIKSVQLSEVEATHTINLAEVTVEGDLVNLVAMVIEVLKSNKEVPTIMVSAVAIYVGGLESERFAGFVKQLYDARARFGKP